MKDSVAPKELHDKIIMGAVLAGLFFGLMPPYVLTIVVVATWGVPPLEAPDEASFRNIYFLRMAIGTQQIPPIKKRQTKRRVLESTNLVIRQ